MASLFPGFGSLDPILDAAGRFATGRSTPIEREPQVEGKERRKHDSRHLFASLTPRQAALDYTRILRSYPWPEYDCTKPIDLEKALPGCTPFETGAKVDALGSFLVDHEGWRYQAPPRGAKRRVRRDAAALPVDKEWADLAEVNVFLPCPGKPRLVHGANIRPVDEMGPIHLGDLDESRLRRSVEKLLAYRDASDPWAASTVEALGITEPGTCGISYMEICFDVAVPFPASVVPRYGEAFCTLFPFGHRYEPKKGVVGYRTELGAGIIVVLYPHETFVRYEVKVRYAHWMQRWLAQGLRRAQAGAYERALAAFALPYLEAAKRMDHLVADPPQPTVEDERELHDVLRHFVWGRHAECEKRGWHPSVRRRLVSHLARPWIAGDTIARTLVAGTDLRLLRVAKRIGLAECIRGGAKATHTHYWLARRFHPLVEAGRAAAVLSAVCRGRGM